MISNPKRTKSKGSGKLELWSTILDAMLGLFQMLWEKK